MMALSQSDGPKLTAAFDEADKRALVDLANLGLRYAFWRSTYVWSALIAAPPPRIGGRLPGPLPHEAGEALRHAVLEAISGVRVLIAANAMLAPANQVGGPQPLVRRDVPGLAIHCRSSRGSAAGRHSTAIVRCMLCWRLSASYCQVTDRATHANRASHGQGGDEPSLLD
jgi:hypothetical protein